ncbi:thaumatin family protein [Streptomyces sasae]|uniref:thaumatin family protein n=1 Tax=Streptomyces sasae TaxID=1266772 RepID=UPI00292FAB56|nr:thaumatin family protein [Streptomyces sasae]
MLAHPPGCLRFNYTHRTRPHVHLFPTPTAPRKGRRGLPPAKGRGRHNPPCAAFGGDTYCCRGAWAGRDNCIPSTWPVDYTQVLKRAAPYAYSYAFDDGATMPCKGACSYRITFGTTNGSA